MYLLLVCVAVFFISFKPSGASTKDARGQWTKSRKNVGAGPSPLFLPNALGASFVLATPGLKKTETNPTQASFCWFYENATYLFLFFFFRNNGIFDPSKMKELVFLYDESLR